MKSRAVKAVTAVDAKPTANLLQKVSLLKEGRSLKEPILMISVKTSEMAIMPVKIGATLLVVLVATRIIEKMRRYPIRRDCRKSNPKAAESKSPVASQLS